MELILSKVSILEQPFEPATTGGGCEFGEMGGWERHQHSEDVANKRDPVYELDMNIASIRRLRVYSHIKKHPPSKRKLPAKHPLLEPIGRQGWGAKWEAGYQGSRGINAKVPGFGTETG